MESKNTKNKIITISGEPVSGKGTTVKSIKEQLLNQGYLEKNIHIISTGHEFRSYFNTIIDLIRNINNIDDINKLENLKYIEEIKSIMSNPEYRKKFIEALSKLKSLDTKIAQDFSIEQANNMPELSEIRKILDSYIDEGIKQKGIQINQEKRDDEIWIIDSRIAFKNIQDSFAVRLTCRPDIAGKRLLEDNSRGKEDSTYKSIEDAIEQREKRRIGEINRYKKRYGIDLTDENNYDLIIDTSFASTEDISDTILTNLNNYINNKVISKTWTSPKTLLPLQNELDTVKPSLKGLSVPDIAKSIEKDGYDCTYPIEIIEVDGKKYIIEGHHRNCAVGYLGKTLIPYEVIGKDDEKIDCCGEITARKRASYCRKNQLIGHEWFFDKKDENGNKEHFSYKQVYPNIYKELDKKDEER